MPPSLPHSPFPRLPPQGPFLRYYPTLPRAACPDRSEPRSAWRTANWQTWSAYGRSLVLL